MAASTLRKIGLAHFGIAASLAHILRTTRWMMNRVLSRLLKYSPLVAPQLTLCHDDRLNPHRPDRRAKQENGFEEAKNAHLKR